MGPNADLRFITGKGGVGKTTIAAAYSAVAADHKRRVLAVDAVNRGDLVTRVSEVQLALGNTAGLNPTVLGLTTRQSLDEYIKRYLRVPIAPSSLGPLSRIFDFVSTAAPGVREILTIGKIGHEVVNGPWDSVVVDAPSSGHVIELLAAPKSLARLTPTGPLSSQTEWLQELLESPSTAVTVVATPEELPLAETEQLLGRITTQTDVAVDTLVINRVPPKVSEYGQKSLDLLRRDASDRVDQAVVRSLQSLIEVAIDRDVTAQPYVERLHTLADSFDLTTIEVPDDPLDPAQAAAGAIADAPNSGGDQSRNQDENQNGRHDD